MNKKNSKKRFALALCFILILVISGCGIQGKEDTQTGTDVAQKTEEETISTEKEATSTEGEAISIEDNTEITDMADESSVLSGLPTFIFASGAGAWDTTLTIYEDGTFEGYFHDSDMGDDGADYPYGTVYTCQFHGSFTDIRQVNEYTYSMRLETIELSEVPGKEWIEGGVRYISSEPYGLDNAEEVLLYLPGAPTAELPEEFINWIAMPNAWSQNDIPVYLEGYGLYNVNAEQGFYGY